jgi:trehalose 6-phosphate phosphatase
MAVDPGDSLAALRTNPASAGIFADYDGTLSPIVADPRAAQPVASVPELLDQLARRYAVVAVVSGRPLAFLTARFSDRVVLSGLYGLEVQRHNERHVEPEAERWRAIVAGAATRCRAEAPAGVLVEDKGLSLTLHYRTHPALEAQVLDLAERVAAATGLVVRPAPMSVELHPRVHADKGTAVRELAAGLGAVCYLGDDIGDLAAFRALDDLAARGVTAVRIAVRSNEAPAELLHASNVTVDGPAGAAALLGTLL